MNERASLALALSGRYEIERELGAGGMATVYLARDIKHARQVALKVLHPELAAALGPERFLAEIRTTANLQHPHILPLHDSGEADGYLYYVMPFFAGEALRQRLDRETQLPVEDAVRIAREILAALDYAHRQGIVHRDIKPENILLHDGSALVADFGIALAVQSAGGQRMTQTGLSLGTPQYMSPEQAMGEKNIDGRADVYATGAVLYEMLTGEPPFSGASVQAIVAKVMTERPMSPRTVRDTIPPHIEAAVMRALAKLPADRFATGKDFSDALDGRGNTAVVADVSRRSSARTRALPWIVAAAMGALAGGAAVFTWHRAHHETNESVRFTVEPPAGMSIYDGPFERPFALSADGRSVLFGAGTKGALYLRRLDQLQPVPVAGVERMFDYHFSPDGKSMAYVLLESSPSLRTLRFGGGEGSAPFTVLADSAPQQFTWSRAQDIVYPVPIGPSGGIWRLSAGGGAPRRIVARDTADGAWVTATVLEDGRTVAFRAYRKGEAIFRPTGQLRLVSIDGGPVAKVELAVENILGYADGFLIYGAGDGRIMGVRFDLASRKVRGEPVALLDNVTSRPISGLAAALGANGTLAYLSGASTTRVDIVNEHGVTLSTLALEPRKLTSVNWSPDGTRVVLQSRQGGMSSDLWVYDTLTRVTTRLTRDGGAQAAVWTPDSKRIAYLAPGKPRNVLVWMPADGSAPAEPIAAAAKASGGFSFSADGKYVFANNSYRDSGFSTSMTAFPLDGGAPTPMLPGVKSPFPPKTSPDGRWMVYSSLEGERREVYIRPFPSGTGRIQVSTHGGDSPKWSRDGRQIIYHTPASFRVATVDPSGALPRLVRDDSLFADVFRQDFSVHPDGKRFALLRDAGDGPKLVIVTHWLDEALAKLRGSSAQ